MSKLILLVGVTAALVFLTAQPAQAVVYQPPVDGTIIDSYYPPATPYGPGHRGWDYSAAQEASVDAAADGTVTFAGQVGGVLNVVLLHSDGVLTTYSKLASISVRRGQTVQRGTTLGTTAGDVYFGARCHGQYIDPATLFTVWVHLVPLTGTGTGTGIGPAEATSGPGPCSSVSAGLVSAEPASEGQLEWLSSTLPPSYWPKVVAALAGFRL